MPEQPLNRTAPQSDNCLMKFGVSITALIKLSLTKYLFTPQLGKGLKTTEQYFILFYFFSRRTASALEPIWLFV